MRLLALILLSASQLLAYDFTMDAAGPRNVTAGYDLYIRGYATLTEGERDYLFWSVLGLPEGATASYPRLEETCCGENKAWLPEPTDIKIAVSGTTAAGVYQLTIQGDSGGVQRQAQHTIEIHNGGNPEPPEPPPSTGPKVAEWESHMTSYGEQHCDEGEINRLGTWEGSVWFYDGIWAYYQVQDYTADAKWATCAGYVRNVYRPYVLDNDGKVSGWRVFPHGLYQDFLRRNDELSKRAVILLSENAPYAASGGNLQPARSRETAYQLQAYILAEKLGQERHPSFDRAVAYALGHLDQWFNGEPKMAGDRTPEDVWYQSFMVGLTMHALIDYWQDSQDPRVLQYISLAADKLWDQAWRESNQSFLYLTSDPKDEGAPDLNLLIATAYAWLWAQTGDVKHIQRGDKAFNGGVDGAYLGQGKQWTQNYRWSFDYHRYRAMRDVPGR